MDIKKEMLKTINELYWHDTEEFELLTDFINGFFDQYQPESSKREDYTDEEAIEWRMGNVTEEQWNQPRCKSCLCKPFMCRCGTPNTMET